CLYLLMLLLPISALFPYTTLFRSGFGLRTQPTSQAAMSGGWPSQAGNHGMVRAGSRAERGELHGPAVYARSHSGGFSLDGLGARSEEHTSELQSRENLVCRLLLEK